ncbi:MAG: beta-ketoacyl-ACP synthase III [Chloracidobacterium sp.]|uniref:Beta-ketoacyl-[acyl-carrier-protein] synthase III n=1 Tax=Chloracidobacterium validum TaxID=2821543 RepID=A0ABX8B8L2_9BACT|nr:beta-ketoacyl-ACP synthase III [Chloracidobacterium validum]QUW02024.1 ketoacyl-ACP synthase III [Chloracidobacterium validum]
MPTQAAGIIGTGRALPERTLTNADLEKMVETSDEWIVSRTGIRERRIAAPDETTSHFATIAAQRALDAAGIAPNDLDLIICATVCPDMMLPSTACLIQSKLGARRAAAYDLVAACSGFIYGLATARSFIEAGHCRHALVIGAELLSRFVDYTDRATCVIFGDGAGAAVLGPVAPGRGILAHRILSDGNYADLLYTPGGGTRYPASPETIEQRLHYIKMRGNELFKVAVRSMSDTVGQILDELRLTPSDVDLFIPHQANQRITDAVANRLDIGSERIYANIERMGNTSSASIPIALDECVTAGRVKPGNLIVFASFGAGVTWGAMAVRW